MKYLFIDTSADNLIIAIIDDDKIIYYSNISNGKDTSSKVMPVLDEAFKKQPELKNFVIQMDFTAPDPIV